MRCPYCFWSQTQVLDSRESDSQTIRRRRECEKCAKRFTTYERMELLDLTILKRDKRRELFSRDKVLKGMIRACEKRPVRTEELQKAVDRIESTLRNMDKTEIPASKIGTLVMEELKRLDDVAYIRFASVYRKFAYVGDFASEIAKLKKTKKNE